MKTHTLEAGQFISDKLLLTLSLLNKKDRLLIQFFTELLLTYSRLYFTDASCNFDTWYCGWNDGPTNPSFKWTRRFGPTPSRDTGPSRDHTSGRGNLSVFSLGPGSLVGNGAKMG